MQAQLRDKQRELLELQIRKLDLELAATRKQIDKQKKELSLQTASIGPMVNHTAEVLPKINSTVQLSTPFGDAKPVCPDLRKLGI